MRSRTWKWHDKENPDRPHEEAGKSLKVQKTGHFSKEMPVRNLNLLPDNVEGNISSQNSTKEERKLYELYKKLGEQYVLVGEYRPAIDTFTKAINMALENKLPVIELYRSRAESYYNLGDYENSGNDLKEILNLDAEDLLAQKSLLANFELQHDLRNASIFFQGLFGMSKERLERKLSQMTTQFQEILIDLADRCTDCNKLQQVEKIFQNAIDLNPQNVSVYNSIGNIYFYKNNFAKAAAFYKKALKVNPSFVNAEYNLGLIDENNNQPDSAFKRYLKVQKMRPDFEPALVRIAAIYFNNARYRDAKKIYDSLLALNNTSALYHYDLGVIEERLGDREAALKNYRTAININPEYEEAHNGMAEIYYNKKDYLRAKEIYHKLTLLFPQNETNFYNLGLVEEILQNSDAAFDHFLTAVNINSDYLPALSKIAPVYFNKGDYQNAKAVYERLIKINSWDADNYYDMGLIESTQQNWASAIENYQRAIRLNPDIEDALYKIAEIYFDNKNYESAKKIYRKLINKRPESKDYSYIGLIEEHQRKWDAAIRNYRKALELNQQNTNALSGLARTYFNKGNYQNAKRRYQQLITLDPENDEGYYFLGVIEQENKKWNKAIEYYQKAICLQPTNAGTYASLGDLYDEMGKTEDAVEQLQLAIKYNPSIGTYHCLLGYVYTRYKGNITYQQKALNEFLECTHLDPGYRYSYAAIAACYKRMGNEAEFARYAGKVKEIRPQPREDEYVQASTEALCGNLPDAVRLLKIVFEKELRSGVFVAEDPDFEFIRNEPEFQALVETDQKSRR